MSSIASELSSLGELDALAARETPIHRRDPRAKVLATLAFVAAVVSFGKYDLSALFPFFLFPVALAALGEVPPRPILLRLLIAAPFVLFLGVFNPFFDRVPLVRLGDVVISGGWISFASIVLRFALTLSAALVLVATTGMTAVCVALTRLKVPRLFAVQLLLLYRYLFVLMDEGLRMVRAHALRAGGRRLAPRVFVSLSGQLLLRALDRAHRLHAAMLCRGFAGEFHLTRRMHFTLADLVFVLGWTAFFAAARCWNLPRLLGQAALGIVQ